MNLFRAEEEEEEEKRKWKKGNIFLELSSAVVNDCPRLNFQNEVEEEEAQLVDMPPLPTFTIGKWFFYGRISLSLFFLFLFLVNESTIKTMDETKEYCSRNGMEMPERDTATARGTPVYKTPVRRHYRNLL